ncbi:flagellar basal body rod protein FlgG [Clostridium novyi B str. ATCC 27606]|uniref:Flagellar basal body rod protein FlgG n=2 Tax=Clostridium TaxID=1485 RepID=A0AA40ISX7_CLONO|nr:MULTISPECIES: flagellar hook-basal body complex protein [Clostridium]KEI13160.1 flagellar basal body rod protein FlgG [Clostridium novyi B str. NCTC 9691]KEI14370.1 flagellar basal body rod protein FlgG [Clostridium novyi B str. ATCC 27606]KEI16167.1 flagellar basal body rod protein FlgG [Clostridium haemolyticum NCTC 9693]KGN03735.1 flagellar basal body rod protein FlgG [Clostridium haemolyticum NCTC 8350]
MIRGIYTAVSGLINQEAIQDVISNNLANSTTVGYKKDDLITRKFQDVMLHNYDKVVRGKNVRNDIGELSMGSKIDETCTNYSQGVLEDTGKSTDFAIQGNGFFVVSRNDRVNNQNLYTRDGHFHIDRNGYLVNSSGDKVMGKNLSNGAISPINILVNNNPARMACNDMGEIYLNGKPAFKMQVVNFGDYKSLRKIQDNLYSGTNPKETNDVIVKQNYLEKSNVNVMAEVSDMMMTMRNFESNQKVVQALDETLGKTVNEVGRV